VVSLGGGVVGDLAGFAASIHRRGVSVAHLPTSLLAQVDSCLGGKTAINLPSGRNLAGTFHQPRFVLAAVDLLETLPPRHFRSGLAEAIKCGMLADRPLLDWIGGRRPRRAGDLGAEERVELVTRCLEIKARVVMEDERETGLRRVLNLGHTLGHALESVTGYSEALYHGEAVAIGMVVAARLSEQRGLSPGGTAARLQRLLDLCGLPDSVPIGVEVEALLAAMRQDKKRLQGHAVWVLPRGLGQVTVVEGVTEEEIRTALAV
jgi:3-dehydroquinate synthase